jgi:hypothetical protein
VTYEGYPYLAKSNVPSGNLPTDELYWMPLLTGLDFAPGGYGLGGQVPLTTADAAVQTGFYRIWLQNTLGYTGYVNLMVINNNDQIISQTAFGVGNKVFLRIYYNTWGDWVDWSPSAFAPSGYGLGLSDSTPLCSNANDAWQNGWFKIDSSTQNGIGVSAIMRVDARASAYSVCQTAYSTSWSSAYPVVRQRWCMNGTWDTEWSWVDPPMQLGVEYRTTERWNGKSVWTALIDCGTVVAGENVINTNFSCDRVIGGRGYTGAQALPYIYSAENLTTYSSILNVARSSDAKVKITISRGSGVSPSSPAYVQVWYTKN